MWSFLWLALRLQGCRPVRITALSRPDPWEDLDGLLIGGGDDIGADLYGMEPVPDLRVDPERDRLELEGLRHHWPLGTPILGICRGAQMINIFRGGSLHQDIYEIYEKAPRMRTVLPRKRVALIEGTRLHDIIERETVTVNALHHQSIDRTGDGVRITGLDEAGVVQAIEHDGADFRVGVQWHPEFLFYRSAHWRLFRAFTRAAKRVAAERRSAAAETATRSGA